MTKKDIGCIYTEDELIDDKFIKNIFLSDSVNTIK